MLMRLTSLGWSGVDLFFVLGERIYFGAAARLAIRLFLPGEMTAVYILLPCRIDSLLFGVLAAYCLRQKGAWDFLCAHRRLLWTVLEALTVVCAFWAIH